MPVQKSRMPDYYVPIPAAEATALPHGRYPSYIVFIDADGKPIDVGSSYTLPAATTAVLGGVKKAATQANSTATDVAGLLADFNGLLAKLKTAGIMA